MEHLIGGGGGECRVSNGARFHAQRQRPVRITETAAEARLLLGLGGGADRYQQHRKAEKTKADEHFSGRMCLCMTTQNWSSSPMMLEGRLWWL